MHRPVHRGYAAEAAHGPRGGQGKRGASTRSGNRQMESPADIKQGRPEKPFDKIRETAAKMER